MAYRQLRWIPVLLSVVGTGTAWAEPAAPDTMLIPGGQEGAVFEDMTIQGEDRIQIEFDRPSLTPNLDPKQAPGLEWENTLEILDRNGPSLFGALLAWSSHQRSVRLARPWFRGFSRDGVARFHPQVEGVDRWTLTVADSKGRVVKQFEGKGKAPKELVWDGRGTDGEPASPGLTYSYVFEAYDRAGNKRNFIGDGFELPPYGWDTDTETGMMFSARSLKQNDSGASLLVEAASWINQRPGWARPVQVTATARSYEQAQDLAQSVVESLVPLLLGDPIRVAAHAVVEPDAPAEGTLTILSRE